MVGWQEARPRKDRRTHVEKVEARQLGCYVEIGLEKGPDRPDVLPVALKNVGEHAVGLNGAGNDVFAEVRESVVEQFDQDVAVEYIDTHRREVNTANASHFLACFTLPFGE